MEKIIILIGPSGVERTALDFACYLTNITGSALTGLFLHEIGPIESNGKTEKLFCHTVKEIKVLPKISLENINTSKREFIRFCDNHGLAHVPDIKDAQTPGEVILESRFADLLIVSSESSFSTDIDIIPTDLVTSILKKSECPVIIAPLTFSHIKEIVFTYDGSASSVYAIKQFTHLFPQFRDVKTTFLEVNNSLTTEIDYKEKILEYLKMHYSFTGFQVLKGIPENQLFSYFLNKNNVFIVMGAFGKKIVPPIFNRSTATLLLKTTSLPVFISHK